MRSLALAAVLAAISTATLPSRVQGQTPASNAVYLELGGSGGLLSVNYERRVSAVQMRVGYGNWSYDDSFGGSREELMTVPLTLSHVRGSGSHHLESGAGVTFGNRKEVSTLGGGTTESNFTTLTGLVGYRYQKPGSGFLFRALFTPMFGLGDEEAAYPDRGFFPSVGISFGAAFR